jgi:hypothetical protein
MIPRRLHYCWFGGRPKPPLIERCIASWRQHLAGWDITEWNEANFDLGQVPYTAAAAKAGMWAFVTDLVRLWALWNHGGIYMDADVEVTRNLDHFRVHRAFTGMEADQWMLSATMGAEARHPWIGMLLRHYEAATFGDRTPNTQVVTRLSASWVECKEDGFTFLRDGVVIYPTDYFTPYDHQALRATPTERTHCVHHFAGTWLGRTPV